MDIPWYNQKSVLLVGGPADGVRLMVKRGDNSALVDGEHRYRAPGGSVKAEVFQYAGPLTGWGIKPEEKVKLEPRWKMPEG